jgi:hypothetical protein
MARNRNGVLLKISVLPTDVTGVIAELERVSAGGGAAGAIEWSLAGRAALGVLRIGLDGQVEGLREMTRSLQGYTRARSGSCLILQAPAGLKPSLQAPEHIDGRRRVIQAIKAQFDPHGVLPPAPDA